MEKHIQNWVKKLKQSCGINILQTVNGLHRNQYILESSHSIKQVNLYYIYTKKPGHGHGMDMTLTLTVTQTEIFEKLKHDMAKAWNK